MNKRIGLSGSTLKILACVFMLIDHIGAKLFPQYSVLRLIGRLAFPIFAFCIAEGCRYTRHKGKHLALIAGFGVVWEGLLIWYYGDWEGNIFLTFSLSVVLIYLWQWIKKQWCSRGIGLGSVWLLLYAVTIAVVWCLTEHLHFEYRFFGVMAAPMTALFDYKEGEAPPWMKRFDHLPVRLLLLAAALFLIALPTLGRTVQVYALLAIPVLAFYNGTAGNPRLKYAFYVFYPVHLIILGLVREWMV